MADILEKVKSALGITGNYQDGTLQIYIDEVKDYMISAGVSESVVNSDMSAGVISRGVIDLWNYGSSGGKLSEYFYQRVTQLSLKSSNSSSEVSSSNSEILSISLNVDGGDNVKSGSVAFTDGTVMPVDIVKLPELTITATDVDINETTLTTLTIEPALTEGNHYIYRMTSVELPALGEVVTDTLWKEWNGVDEIDTDGQERMTVIEVDEDSRAVAGGYAEISVIF